MSNPTDDPYDVYQNIVYARNMGDDDVWDKNHHSYIEALTYYGRQPAYYLNNVTNSGSGTTTGLFGQYAHDYEKKPKRIDNDGGTFGNWFFKKPGFLFRNHCVAWTTLDVQKNASFLIVNSSALRFSGSNNSQGNNNISAILVQGTPDPLYWFVSGTTLANSWRWADAFDNCIKLPVGLNETQKADYGGGINVGWKLTATNPDSTDWIQAKPYRLPDAVSGSSYRRWDLVQCWGHAGSSNNEPFDQSGAGGEFYNDYSLCTIVYCDGNEIARLPYKNQANNRTSHFHLAFNPTSAITEDGGPVYPKGELEYYSNPTGKAFGTKNLQHMLLNYKNNSYDGDETATEIQFDPAGSHDLKVVNTNGLDSGYDIAWNPGMGYTSIPPARANTQYFPDRRFLTIGEDGTDSFGTRLGPDHTYGTFPNFTIALQTIAFEWSWSPYGILHIVIYHVNNSIGSARFLRFRLMAQQETYDITDKTWHFDFDDVTEFQINNASSTLGGQIGKQYCVGFYRDAFDQMLDPATGKIAVTINY